MKLTRILSRIKLPARFTCIRAFSEKSIDIPSANVREQSRIALSTGQIEQYKRRLYDLIKQKRDLQEVNQLTRFLLESCEPSLHLFNVILKGQLMMRNVEGIKETLLLIAKNKFAFNAVTLNLLLVYYRDLDMMEDAEKLFRAMENRRTNDNPLINCAGPNLSAYTTMIAGWARRGNYSKAKQYYEAISQGGLVPDEHATCALLSAAVNLGKLEEARKLFGSLKDAGSSFVALKLWLRACFRFGGHEECLERLLEKRDGSLELSELIKWIVSDLKGDEYEKLGRVAMHVIDVCMGKGVRLGDPQCLHSLLDALKRDANSLERFASTCLKWSEMLLPVIGGRLVHQLMSLKSMELGVKVVNECKRIGVKLPSGLLQDFANLNQKQ